MQQALRDLGYDAPDSGEFDPATRGALAQFFADRQIRPEEQTPEGALQLEDVLWLPSPAVTLEGCEVGLGQDVSEGQAVATTRGDITALTFPVPDGLHAGPRHIILEGYRPVPAQDSGRLTDSALIRWLEEQNGAALDLASSQEGAPMTLPARFELIEPIEVYGVPPSALIGVAGQSVCVNDGESTIRAAIVASSLGVTYLTFENAQVPPSVRLEPDRGLRCG